MYVSGLYIARSIESVGTPMTPDASDPSNTCLPVRSLFIVEFKTTTTASGTIVLGSKARSFSYILNAVIFLMARPGFESRVDQYIFILYIRKTRFSCDYSVILTVL